MPEAVTVATVAEPVARRISTATSQASSSTEMCAPLTQSAMRSPMPVSTRVCLNPPPAATISRMPAIGGSDCLERLGDAVAVHPGAAAEGEHGHDDGDEQRDQRGADEVEDLLRPGSPSSSTKMSAIALPIISTTGSSTVASG